MHRDQFIRLKRGDPPSDPNSESELMIFSNAAGRAGQVDHNDVFHLFAWLDEITGGGGIQFDTDPQDGDWLYVRTTGVNPSRDYSIEFRATGSAEDNEATIELLTNDSDTGRLNEIAVGQYNSYLIGLGLFGQGGTHLMNSGGGLLYLRNTSPEGIQISDDYTGSGGTGIFLGTFNSNISVSASDDLDLGAGGTVGISAGGGTGLLEIWADGTYHIKTGATWVADL
jgi:hypothetical protein